MSEPALIVNRSDGVTPGLRALVAAQGYGPVSTLVSDRPENGRYYLSPATVEQIEGRLTGDRSQLTVVVDGTPHPGQIVDL